MPRLSPSIPLASSKAVVVMGGSFDPVHFGHLIVASQVLDQLNVDKMCLMPCYQSAFKQERAPNVDHRKTMLELAIADDNRFHIDYREIERDFVSYTVDTLEEMRGELGTSVPIIWLMGEDAWHSFSRWHRWHDILGLSSIAVCTRHQESSEVGDELQSAFIRDKTVSESALAEYACGKVAFLSTSRIDISSSLIKDRIAQGKSINYFVPNKVAEYIELNKLYQC